MILNTVLGLMCLVISCITVSLPLPFANKVSTEFFLNGPAEESFMANKRILEVKQVREPEQISLSSLVDNFEKNIFASTLSLSKTSPNKHVTTPEIEVNSESHVVGNKSQMLRKEEDNMVKASTITIANSVIFSPKNDIVIFKTTEKVQQAIDVPAHIITNNIDIQQHTENVASTPILDLERTKNYSDIKKAHEATVSKIETVTVVTPIPVPSNSISSSNTTITTDDTTVATPKNIEQLKEAEEELKEKLAEIEAEPVILSARV